MGRWRDRPVPKEATTGTATNRASGAAEQDQAAGGRENRLRRLLDGTVVTASVALKSEGARRRLYGYLRYSVDGKTHADYIGEIPEPVPDRATNLAAAWALVHQGNMLSDNSLDRKSDRKRRRGSRSRGRPDGPPPG